MELRKMAKILKGGNAVPAASLGKYVAGIAVVVIGAFMVAEWATSIFVASSALFTGLIGHWPVGAVGIGAIVAAGLWLGEASDVSKGAQAAAVVKRGSVEMASPVMVNPQVAFVASRVK
jgi:hypothetical protein